MTYIYKPNYQRGKWNVQCQVCHDTYKHDELKKDWRGLWVCDVHFDDVHIESVLPLGPDPYELSPPPNPTGHEANPPPAGPTDVTWADE